MIAAPPTVDLASDLVMYSARLVRAVRRDHELPAGFRVVSVLDQYGPLGVSALATLDRCSQPTMSALVSQLAELGWVAKRPNPADGRGTVVTLTDLGARELARVRRAHGATVAERLAHHPQHTPEDLATAVAVLRDLLTDDPREATP